MTDIQTTIQSTWDDFNNSGRSFDWADGRNVLRLPVLSEAPVRSYEQELTDIPDKAEACQVVEFFIEKFRTKDGAFYRIVGRSGGALVAVETHKKEAQGE